MPTATLSAQTTSAEAESLAEDVETQLARYQRELYKQTSFDMTAGSLITLTNKLAGAKQLLDTFVNFGFNDALESDDYFHGLVFGGQRILDREAVVSTYAVSATLPVTGMHILENPRVQLTQTGNKRSAALRERGLNVLSAIGALTHQEFIGMIANARQELHIVQGVDSQIQPDPNPNPPPTPDPITAKRFYIPLAQR